MSQETSQNGSPFPFKEIIPKCDLPGFIEIIQNRGLKGAVHAKCSVRQFMEVRRPSERWFLETLLLFARSSFPARLGEVLPQTVTSSSAGSQSSRLEEHEQAEILSPPGFPHFPWYILFLFLLCVAHSENFFSFRT